MELWVFPLPPFGLALLQERVTPQWQHADLHPTDYLRRTDSLRFSLGSSPLSGSFSCDAQLPWSHNGPALIPSTHTIDLSITGNCLYKLIYIYHGTYFLSFRPFIFFCLYLVAWYLISWEILFHMLLVVFQVLASLIPFIYFSLRQKYDSCL